MNRETPPELAIILVGTDGLAPFLGPCLETLPQACGEVPYRVIVVDNDGEGATSRVAQAYSDRMPISVLNQPSPRGFAANVNDALRFVEEPFVLLLNVDTELPPGAIERALAKLKSLPDVGALSVRMRGQDDQLQSSARAFPTPAALLWEQVGLARIFPRSRCFGRSRLYYVSRESTTEVDWASGAFLLLRAEALERVGGLDDGFYMYSEDTDLCYRLWRAGYRVVVEPSITIFHWKDPLRAENRRFTFWHTHRSLLRFWAKHGSAFQRLALRAVLLLGLAGRFLTSPLLLKRGRRYFWDSVVVYGQTVLLVLGFRRD